MCSTVIKKSQSHGGTWPQWLAAVEVFLMAIMMGLVTGWTSPYLAKLSRPDSTLPINAEEASWLASLINISRPAGAIFGAIFTSIMGSKISTLLIGIPYAVGWSCFLLVNSVSLFYVSRILSGIGIGMFYSSFPLYIGEISDPKIRGALVSFTMQGLLVGILVGNIMGAYLDTWLFAAISLIPNLIYLITFSLLPHTPQYYVSYDKFDEAAKSIQWYHRNTDVTTELESLKQFIKYNRPLNFCDTLKSLNTPINRRTILMVNIIYVFLQLSGLFTVSAYLEIMFIETKVTIVTPSLLVISTSILSIIFSWVGMYTNDRVGRTYMLAISCFGVALALCLWGLNYLFLDLGHVNPQLQWISIVAAMIYQISMAVGLMPVPTTLMSEMFAPQIKSFAACITNITSAIFAFVASKSYQSMVDTMSAKYVFLFYAILMIILAIYTLLCVPETKGKTLAEIQEILEKRGKFVNSTVDKNEADEK